MNTNATVELEGLAAWSAPKEVPTKYGPRIFRQAAPTEAASAAWRTRKEELKALGIGWSKDQRTGEWKLTWWQKLDQQETAKREEAKAASTQAASNFEPAAPAGREYLPFQKAGIEYIIRTLRAGRGCLVGDEMGLGKTIQAIGTINAIEDIHKVLVICPNTLKINWRNECAKWLVRPMSVAVQYAGAGYVGNSADVVIINYDIVSKFPQLAETTWDLRVCDESHFVKNSKAKRTKAVLAIPARYKLALTGTPILNRPIELFTTLQDLDRAKWPNVFGFAKRYCNPPEAPIMMGDFSCKPIGEIKPGDEIIGWKKGEPGCRSKKGQRNYTLCRAMVTEVHRHHSQIVKVMMASGKVIRCTIDHRWLNGGNYVKAAEWITPNIGRVLAKVVDDIEPLPLELIRDAGWLAGIYDGEGTWPRIAQCQSANAEVYDRISETLERFGFDCTCRADGVYVKGGRQEALRFMQWVNPKKKGYLERAILSHRFRIPDEVIGVWPDGEGEVIGLTTSTGNYIAWGYASKNCNAHNNGYGWDFSGASNLEELQDRLRSTIMVRRLKSQVLTELPAKRRQVIELPANGSAGLVARENAAWDSKQDALDQLRARVELAKASDNLNDYTVAVEALREGQGAAFAEMAKLRHDIGMAKFPQVVDYVRDALESSKVIVFAHHLDVVGGLVAEFPQAAVVTGETPADQRQGMVEKFQTNPECNIFIGNLAAAEGLTLTAATHVIFAEGQWVPGKLAQMEDRAHRIGQTESVLISYLVLEGSLDAVMAQACVEKMDVADLALDRAHAAITYAEPPAPRQSNRLPQVNEKRDRLLKLAETLSDADVAEVHGALRRLAGCDWDHATEQNGVGFNKVDGRIGHELANLPMLSKLQAALGAVICRKYHGQIGEGCWSRK
jgi:superfamily II DNA or RNA helicase